MVSGVKETVADKFSPLSPDFVVSVVFGHSLAHSGAVLSVSESQVGRGFFGVCHWTAPAEGHIPAKGCIGEHPLFSCSEDMIQNLLC